MKQIADVVICGAGIAGISSAYHLAINHGVKRIILVDERSPLSLTSDKSTECYRNWWPGPGNAMVALMNRSIDLLEELADKSGNTFHLNRRGYLYMTADPDHVPIFAQNASIPPELGAGQLRIHTGDMDDPEYLQVAYEGYANQPTGADLFLNPDLIRQHFPYLSPSVLAALHVRRAGWFSAQQLGRYLLDQSRLQGVKTLSGKVSNIRLKNGKVDEIILADGRSIATKYFVNAAGPFVDQVTKLIGVSLPVYSELHMKAAFRDDLQILPRNTPLLIWSDTQQLSWSADERQILSGEREYTWLLEEMPAGVHTRPEGGLESDIILMLWEYHTTVMEPTFPPPVDDQYPEIALRGLATMIPGLAGYLHKIPRPILDGGYYTRTWENRPLIGPLPVDGAFVIGALSGFGLMAACAAGELLAAHLTHNPLPDYAPAFSIDRYNDPEYLKNIEHGGHSGQL